MPHTDLNSNRFSDDSGSDWHCKYQNSGSIKIVQSKDPYACKTYACKTPSNQSVSSFMESIKDKSSLKILVVMI